VHARTQAQIASKFQKKQIVRREKTSESPSILRIVAHQARKLPAKDDNGLSDPFLCFHYGESPAVSTEIRHKTLTPQWNQTIDISVWKIPPDVPGLENSFLTIKCWDWEESGLDQYMGSVDVNVEELELDGEPIEGWFLLEDPAEPDAFGEIEVTISWITRPSTAPDAIISVNVLGAQELPPMGSHGFVDPFVKIKYSGDPEGEFKSTDTRLRTMDPSWLEIFEFPARSGEVGHEYVEVHVFHKSTFKDKLIGWTRISLAGFNFEREAVYYDLEPHDWDPNKKAIKGEGSEDLGRIHLQIKLKKKRLVDHPDAAIRITLMEAKNIPPRARADICDPYLQVEFEKVVKKTQVRFKQSVSSCPEWSETFVFEAWSDRLDSSMVITMMDQQEWRKDKVIGSVPLNLLDYHVGDFYEEWKLLQCPAFPESRAELKYQISIRNKPKDKECDAQLRVRIIEAKDLPALDWGGTSDPYVVATFENKTRKTSTIFKTLHPVWNELLTFNTKSDEMDLLLRLECFDQDFGGKDDTCGRCDIDLHGMQMNDTVKEWMPLRDLAHPEYQGSVRVEVTLSAKSVALDPDCNLMITVVGCKDLVAADASGTSDPFVVIDFDNERQKTGTRFKTTNPIFDEKFEFPHHSSHIHELCRFEVIDYDLLGSNESLGFVFLKMGDLKIDQRTDLNLQLRLREDDDPTGELNLVVTLKRRSEFTVNLMPRSKSMDILQGFTDLSTGVAKSEPAYTLRRKLSFASSGVVLDCESTNPILSGQGQTGFVDELHEAWLVEQEARRVWDLQYTTELRTEQVQHSLKRNRNANGRCAFCGELFTVVAAAVQCPVDKFWYHVYNTQTVKASDSTCYEGHKEPLKTFLKRKKQREDEKEDEMRRRVLWDREHEREKASKANRSRLKKAVMARDFSKMAKRTRQEDIHHNPPFAVDINFDDVEFEDFTKHSKNRRRFLQQLREDVSSVLNIEDAQVSVMSLDASSSMVVIQISDDPEGKDRWTPEQLAKRLVKMITGNTRNQKLYSTQVLVSAIQIDVRGPVLSAVAKMLLNHDDVQVHPKAKGRPKGFAKPDQAGRLPCYVYICSDFDDMRPEREFLAKNIFPSIDQWCATARAQFVPVDMRYGVTRPECYHANVVATHLDEIDRCFPYFVCMLGSSYGWVPDDYYRNYGQLDEPRFDWLKEMPDSLSLVHIEILHAYFEKKLGNDDGPGGGRDDDYCLFYFRDPSWMNDPSFITDYQVQAAKTAAERRALNEKRALENAAAREMEEMGGSLVDLSRMNYDYVDIRILSGFDLGYELDQKKSKGKDDRKKNLRKGDKVSSSEKPF
jgi:hypothetical protein